MSTYTINYGYEDKPDEAHYCYGGHGSQGIVLPPAYIDGTDIKWTSVMVCEYWHKNNKWESVQPQSIFTRTALDYEMILFAWRDNQLQCYVSGIFGLDTQAYFH